MKKWIQSNNHTQYDEDVIIYGFQVLMFNLLSVLLMLIVSYINNTLQFGFWFIVFFGIMRIRYGGTHCKTPIGCILVMMTVFEITTLIYKVTFIPVYYYIFSIITLVYTLYKKQKEIVLFGVIGILGNIFFENRDMLMSFCLAYVLFQILYYLKFHQLH